MNYDEAIPALAIEQKQGIDYVSHWYIYTRMNQFFGNENWTYTVLSLDCVSEDPVTYLSRVQVTIKLGSGTFQRDDVGTGVGRGKAGHENAPKGAVTDGLKRAVHGLGQSFGLALYDADKQYVCGTLLNRLMEAKTLAELEALIPEVKELGRSNPDSNVYERAKNFIVTKKKEMKNE